MDSTAPAAERLEHRAPVIRVFGGIGLSGEDGPISIGGPRQRRLLALLAIRAGSAVEIDWLAEYLWDDQERPDDAAPSLRTFVYRLRSAFPEQARDWIQTEPEAYRLAAPSDAVEHLRFARLRSEAAAARDLEDPQTALGKLDQALALWRGEPFREIEDLEWAYAEMERLRIDHLETMEERWEAALALGRHTQITGELAAFTLEHGDRDRAVRQHALALHRSGRTPDALKVIARHRKVLVEEYGLDPSAEILELEGALIKGDPSLIVEKEGRPLRGYRLLEEVGAGAFAIVWRGIQPSVEREVAIKQIRPELASDPDFIRRFEAEAHLVAQVEHPHVVPLVDYWRDADSAYLVMRWLAGGTLERRIDDGPLEVEASLRIAREVGSALAAAHAKALVHRDVKSANILFDEGGNSFLTDFGIALPVARSSGPEAALSPGSPAYSSPEQIRGERLAPSADIFSLGVVLFECLTGTTPFSDSSSTEELIARQLDEPYPRLDTVRPGTPTPIADAIAIATSKDPTDRFATVDAFLGALSTEATDAEEHAPITPAPPIELENPYLGLRAFDDVDAERFYGRERLVAELVGRLAGTGLTSRCLVVVGPSGSGKSSVVRAGLMPALRSGAVPGSDEWFMTTLVPGADPYEALEAALLRIAVNPPTSLLAQLRDGDRGILRGLRRCLPADDADALIVIDQFEEVFTAGPIDDAWRFADALATAVSDPASPLRLIITLRADYYDRPLEHPGFAPVLHATTVSVGPLAGDELERAIVQPAAALGIAFEPGLVARISAEATGQPQALPLLQYALSELFEHRDGQRLTIAAYEAIGGLSGALAARAERINQEADVEQRAAIRRLFGRLLNPGADAADIRRRALISEFADDEPTRWALDRYGEARLITFDRDEASREPTVEVAHEALLREWPRLVGWLDEDLELLRSIDAVAKAATAWEEGGREESDLYRGARLERAFELRSQAGDRLRPLDLVFIEASSAAADAERAAAQRRVRRSRLAAVGIGAAAVLALVVVGVALLQRGEAEEEARIAGAERQQADQATLLARAGEADDPEIGLLLALEAHRRDPGARSDRVLLEALRRTNGARTVATHAQLVQEECAGGWSGWVSRDGTMQTAVVDGMAVSRDLLTGEITEHGPMPDDDCVDWYGDPETGRRFAIGGVGDRLWLSAFDEPWDRASSFRLPAGRAHVNGPTSFGPTRLLLSDLGSESLIDSATGRRIGAPIGDVASSNFARLSADERFVVMSGSDSRGEVLVLDAATADEVSRTALPAQVTQLAFEAATGNVLATAADERLRVIDPIAGQIVTDVPVDGTDIVAIGVRQDGDLVVMKAGPPGRIHVIDRDTGRRLEDVEVQTISGGRVRDDGLIVTWDADGRVDVIDLDGNTLADRSIPLVTDGPEREQIVRLHDDVVITGSRWGYPANYKLIDTETEERWTPDLRTEDGRKFPVLWQPIPVHDGFAAISDEMEVARWRDGELVERFDIAGDGMDAIFFNGRYDKVAIAGVPPEGGSTEVHVLDFTGDRIERGPMLVGSRSVVDAIPSFDGGVIIQTEDGQVSRYDEDGDWVEDVAIRAGSFAEGRPIKYDRNGRIAFDEPSSAAGISQAVVIDLVTGERTIFPSFAPIHAVHFARDGDVLVIQNADGTVRLADIDAGVMSGVVWQGNGTSSAAPWYDEDADAVWIGTQDEAARLPLDPEVWRALACERVGRELSPVEWESLVPGDEPPRAQCP